MVTERKVRSLTELDQEHPITFLLVRRKYNDTSEVVVVIGHLFLSQVGVGYELDHNSLNKLPLKRNPGHDLVGSRRR
jgi:hypothetical protein